MATDEQTLRRTRPKDRSDRIIATATQLFCERGYFAVSLDDIGEAVGITGPAVYRHFDSKEALLVAVIEGMVERYLTSFGEAVASAATPQERLVALTVRTVGPQIEEHNFWPLTVAELRHLPRESVQAIRRKVDAAVQRWVEPLLGLHPELSGKEAEFMVHVGSGLTASLVYYQPALAKRRLVDVLSRMLLAAYQFGADELADYETDDEANLLHASAGVGAPLRSSARERILAQAVPMFRRYGFSGVGIDDVGKAAGVTGPAVYRHFRNKEDVLFAALSRMSEQLAVGAGRALAGTANAFVALERMTDAYLDLVVEDPNLMAVYWTQKHGLSDERRAAISRGERSYIDDWVGVLTQARDGVSEPEARTMVYGAIGLMNGYWQAPTSLAPHQARAILRAMVVRALRLA